MEIEKKINEEEPKKKFSELSEEEKKLWEVDESLLNKSEEKDDDSGRVRVMGAPVVYSTGFVRPYNPLRRPKVSYKNFILALVLFIAGLSAAVVLSNLYLIPYTVYLSIAFSLVYILIIGKKAVIWLVHLYQSKASDDTRLRCRFEPSCSEYMIRSVNKYGFLKGTFKGIRRVIRCHAPNGGIDYP